MSALTECYVTNTINSSRGFQRLSKSLNRIFYNLDNPERGQEYVA